jgi:hypothetical protein
MEIIISPRSHALAVYDEAIDLATLGSMTTRRASHVESDGLGRWFADLAPVSGPRLGPFVLRSQALEAERAWLEVNWLNLGSC